MSEERRGSVKAHVYRDGQIFYYILQESVDEDGIISGVLLEFVRDGHQRVSLEDFRKDMVLRAIDMKGAPLIEDNVLSSFSTFIFPLNHPGIGKCWLVDAKSHYAVEKDLAGLECKRKVGRGIL